MAGGTEADAHPNKRLKTLEPLVQSPSSDAGECKGKGKSMIEMSESDDDEPEFCCGICLAESGQGREIIQGCIDSCDHFFCFLCIMEWSKVESRCPMCKRRFSAIRRPPKPPIFSSERVVQVPLRDQVYHHFGNVSTGPSDPYSEAKCNVCDSSANDCLLLLCDLCDSAYHTYCVGLGAAVPEGDWFCSDCSLLRTEHAKTDTEAECGDQLKITTCHQRSSTGEHMSIFDIVREPQTSYVEGLSIAGPDPSSTLPQVDTSDRETLPNDSNGLASSRPKLSARTLWRCRDVNDRIRIFRENWNGLQSGSLFFPSNQNNVGIAERNPETGEQHSDLSRRQSRLLSKLNDKGLNEIDKAWKMSDIAKSMASKHEGSSRKLNQASKPASKKMNNSTEPVQQLGLVPGGPNYCPCDKPYHLHSPQRSAQRQKLESVTFKESPNVEGRFPDSTEAGGGNSNPLSSNRQHIGFNHVGNIKPGSPLQYHHPLGKNSHGNRSQSSGQKQKQEPITFKRPPNVEERFSTTHLSLQHKPTSFKEDPALFQPNACDKTGHMEKKDSSSSNSSMRSAQTVSRISHAEEEHRLSSSRNEAKPLKDEVGPERIDECRKAKDGNEAKTEIQSLVKLNLKLLSRNEKLEVVKFKETARLATHSILSACGLEQRRPGVPSFPNSICIHVNEDRGIWRSTLMPNSCRECFYSFVKDVVYAIFSERKGGR